MVYDNVDLTKHRETKLSEFILEVEAAKEMLDDYKANTEITIKVLPELTVISFSNTTTTVKVIVKNQTDYLQFGEEFDDLG